VQQHEAQVISEFFKVVNSDPLGKKNQNQRTVGPGYFTPLNEPMVFMKESTMNSCS
jgi:hypothetical protein